VVSGGLPGLVCEGIMSVPVGAGEEGGMGLLVDEKTGSGMELLGSKAMHDPKFGPGGVEKG
jgi:hypothetical protein